MIERRSQTPDPPGDFPHITTLTISQKSVEGPDDVYMTETASYYFTTCRHHYGPVKNEHLDNNGIHVDDNAFVGTLLINFNVLLIDSDTAKGNQVPLRISRLLPPDDRRL